MHVVVIDDEPAAIGLAQIMLNRANLPGSTFERYETNVGAQILDRLFNGESIAILLDHEMPNYSGEEVAHMLVTELGSRLATALGQEIQIPETANYQECIDTIRAAARELSHGEFNLPELCIVGTSAHIDAQTYLEFRLQNGKIGINSLVKTLANVNGDENGIHEAVRNSGLIHKVSSEMQHHIK